MNRVKVVPKVWGDEQWIVNSDYCGKILRLKQYHQCSVHVHKIKSETFLILDGSIFLELGGKNYILSKGEAIDVHAGQYHRFTGISDSIILEFSSHHEDNDSYRTEESRELNKEQIEELESKLYGLSEVNGFIYEEKRECDLRNL